MEIRKADVSDVDKIVELEKDYYDGFSLSKITLDNWIRTGRYYIVERNGFVVGSIYFEFLEEVRALPFEHEIVDEKPNHVYVSEVAVKSGDVFQELFSKVLEAAGERNAKSILWITGEKLKHDKFELAFLRSRKFKMIKHVKKWEYSPGYFISDHDIWELKLI